jgi:ketosteroid isomerase-like protein
MTNSKWRGAAIAAICLIVSALHVSADTVSEATKAIQAQYDRQDAAASRKDAQGVLDTFTKDRVYRDKDGNKITVEEQRQHMTEDLYVMKSCSVASRIVSISIKGVAAAVRVKHHIVASAEIPGRNADDNLIGDMVYDDVWINTGGVWLQKHSVEKSSNTRSPGVTKTTKAAVGSAEKSNRMTAPGSAAADADSDAKKQIQDALNQFVKFANSRNFDGISKLCTPDCKFIVNGKIDDLQSTKANMAMLNGFKMTSTITDCKVTGGMAVCNTYETVSASMLDPRNLNHTMTSECTCRLVLGKSRGQWLLASKATLSAKMTLDGKNVKY